MRIFRPSSRHAYHHRRPQIPLHPIPSPTTWRLAVVLPHRPQPRRGHAFACLAPPSSLTHHRLGLRHLTIVFGKTCSRDLYVAATKGNTAAVMALSPSPSQAVQTFNPSLDVPANTQEHIPALSQQLDALWPDMPAPEYFAALIEYETGCPARTCWSPNAQFKM